MQFFHLLVQFFHLLVQFFVLFVLYFLVFFVFQLVFEDLADRGSGQVVENNDFLGDLEACHPAHRERSDSSVIAGIDLPV